MVGNPRAGALATRTRKNAKDLTADEWARFIAALKGIKHKSRPGGVISVYDEFSALHMGAVEMHRTWRRKNPNVTRNDLGNSDPAHDNPGFLPWHRQFLLEFEAVLQSVDPTVTLPYWDWTDREFNRKLFSPALMGGNGGHNHKGGALVDGPFTLNSGWVVNAVLHRPAWYERGSNGETVKDPKTNDWAIEPSLGRSIVRYMGDLEDLATKADVVEFTKRKAMFGPEKLVLRDDLIPSTPTSPPTEGPPGNGPPLPRGTFFAGDELPYYKVPQLPWLTNPHKDDEEGIPSMEKAGDSDRAFREDVVGFRWGLEGSPHMHNQTHDWFGYHTIILQDDEISGASSMPNVACSTADPIFFMHHCNIDRLWAEWQDAGHYGPIFFPKRTDKLYIYQDVQSTLDNKPIRSYTYPKGHNLDDNLWPWDNNAMYTEEEIQFMVPQYPYTVTARDMLNYRSLGYAYDTSTSLAVNSVTPVIVYLPSTAGKVTHQVFPLEIQRDALYLIAAWNRGTDPATLTINIFPEYEEMSEIDFVNKGFSGKPLPREPNSSSDPAAGHVWKLKRGVYYVVIAAVVPASKPTPENADPAVQSSYEIGVATSPASFKLPDIPIAPGVITNPQVPAESCVYAVKRRYAPINLEDGKPQFRLTKMKGTQELFGINVVNGGGYADIRFDGMDALVQLYGPFDLDNDMLPHFDTNGEPIPGDNQVLLSSQLQIVSSEGCCKREGSGIGSLVTPGRYIVVIFHCSIGPNENRPYKVTYTLSKKARIPFITLGTMQLANPSLYSRAVNVLYRVVDPEAGNLVTQLGQVYKVSVRTEDAATQGQLRIAVFTYAYKKVPIDQDEVPPVDEHHYVLYDNAYWGKDVVTFEPYEDQVLFIRVSILNGYQSTKIKTVIQRVA